MTGLVRGHGSIQMRIGESWCRVYFEKVHNCIDSIEKDFSKHTSATNPLNHKKSFFEIHSEKEIFTNKYQRCESHVLQNYY